LSPVVAERRIRKGSPSIEFMSLAAILMLRPSTWLSRLLCFRELRGELEEIIVTRTAMVAIIMALGSLLGVTALIFLRMQPTGSQAV
jgi:hypothetical protein